jgi:hypothetical protein
MLRGYTCFVLSRVWLPLARAIQHAPDSIKLRQHYTGFFHLCDQADGFCARLSRRSKHQSSFVNLQRHWPLILQSGFGAFPTGRRLVRPRYSTNIVLTCELCDIEVKRPSCAAGQSDRQHVVRLASVLSKRLGLQFPIFVWLPALIRDVSVLCLNSNE